MNLEWIPSPPTPTRMMTRGKMANSGVQSYYTVRIRFSSQSTDHNKEDTTISELNMTTFKKFIKIRSFL